MPRMVMSMEVELASSGPLVRPTLPAGWRLVSWRPTMRSGRAEALVEVIGEHGLGAVDGLFGGLADDHEGAVPELAVGGEGLRGAEEDGGVDVVSAGVHDADLLAGCVFGEDVRGVGDAGLFDDGEGVHVAAHEEGGAGAVFEDADDAEGVGAVGVEADVVGDGVAGLAEGVGEQGRGLLLVVGELGVAVELLVGGDEGGELRLLEGGEGWGLGWRLGAGFR